LRSVIDTNVFLRLVFEEPGWEECGKILDAAYTGELQGIVSAIQFSELYTPLERANDKEARKKLASEITKSRMKIRSVDRQVAEMSSRIRASEKTPGGRWLALADSIILATSLIEKAEILYTLDSDFSAVTAHVKITAPGMSIKEWNKLYGHPIREGAVRD
jgi:predicted nucleic acid-binding protein